MSKHLHVYLSEAQRAHLQSLVRKGSAPARVQTRARILLLSDRSDRAPEGQGAQHRTRGQVAAATLSHSVTVGRICRQFVQEGLEAALFEKPRPGAVPKITGEVEAKLVTLACSEPPTGRDRWTLQLLADELVSLGLVDSITDVAVYNRLKKTRLNPGR